MTEIDEPRRQLGRPGWVAAVLAATLPAWTTILVGTSVTGLGKAVLVSDAQLAVQMVVLLPVFAFVSFVVGVAVCIVLAPPALGFVHWLKLTKSWQVAILGAFGGLLAVLPLIVVSNATPLGEVAIPTMLFIASGTFAGVAAWREPGKASLSI